MKPQMHYTEYADFVKLIHFCTMEEELTLIEQGILQDFSEIPETIALVIRNQRVIIK